MEEFYHMSTAHMYRMFN